MKQRIILALVGSAIISTMAVFGLTERDAKVLLMIRDGESADLELMLTKEAGVMKDTLERAGFQVVVATVSGAPLASGNASLKPDLRLADVKVADYAGFIMPCMAVGSVEEPVAPNPTAVAIIKEAVAAGKIVAAQLGGVDTLAEAGALSGKKFAYFSEEWVQATPSLKGGVYSGNGVVQDGNVITSGICPYMARAEGLQDGTTELTQALITALSSET